MKRPNRALVGIVLGLVGCVLCSPPPRALAQEKAETKKRPHIDSRTPFVHRIPLRDEQDIPITPPKPGAESKDKPAPVKLASIAYTCGKCHDYPAINKGWHFDAGDPSVGAGRPGEPWILTDDAIREDPKEPLQSNTRTQ